MKNVIIGLILILCSCRTNTLHDTHSIGKFISDCFSSQKAKNLLPYVDTPSDTTIKDGWNSGWWGNPNSNNFFIDGPKPRFLKIEEFEDIVAEPKGAIYYEKNASFFALEFTYRRDTSNNLTITSLRMVNLSAECEKGFNPFLPFALEENFKFDFNEKLNRFVSGTLTLKNKEKSIPLDHIKIRIDLTTPKITPSESIFPETDSVFFSQTLEYPIKFNPNDIIQIDIPALRGFQLPFSIKNKIGFNVTMLDYSPKEIHESCLKISELKK